MNKDNQSILRIDEYMNKRWFLNNQYHRENGPAVEYANGDRLWCFYDYLHRIDGPAIEYIDGSKYWYYHGK